MAKSYKRQIKNKNVVPCSYCGRLSSVSNLIHKSCAKEYVIKVLGYELIKFRSPIQIIEEAFK
jgi:hypothetical protein